MKGTAVDEFCLLRLYLNRKARGSTFTALSNVNSKEPNELSTME